MRQNGLKLNVVGISNSKNAIFCREGINLDNYLEELKKREEQPGASVRRDRKDEYLQLRIRGLHGNQADVATLYEDVDEQ